MMFIITIAMHYLIGWLNGFSLPQPLLNSDNKDVSNELSSIRYVNTLNKITADIAFERILCYNCVAKERNYAA